MSTLAERSAVETYNEYYGNLPVNPVINTNTVDYIVQSPLAVATSKPNGEQHRLYGQVASLEESHRELSATWLLQERFRLPLCLEAIQPFLILLSKELTALERKKNSSYQLFEQIQHMLQVALARLAGIATLQRKEVERAKSLQVTSTDLQKDTIQTVYAAVADKTKQRVREGLDRTERSSEKLQAEKVTIERTIQELLYAKGIVLQQLGTLGVRQNPEQFAAINTLLQN